VARRAIEEIKKVIKPETAPDLNWYIQKLCFWENNRFLRTFDISSKK
jgi:hypothetical protein